MRPFSSGPWDRGPVPSRPDKNDRLGVAAMDRQRIKTIVFSSLVCLLPIVLGGALWGVLPEMLARHIGLNGRPDGFSPKGVVVFVFPILFLAIHLLYCFKPDWLNAPRTKKRFWFIPFISNFFFILACVLSV
ncbi:MAG: DUF1648 domain-containing protein [Bacillota bacterium]